MLVVFNYCLHYLGQEVSHGAWNGMVLSLMPALQGSELRPSSLCTPQPVLIQGFCFVLSSAQGYIALSLSGFATTLWLRQESPSVPSCSVRLFCTPSKSTPDPAGTHKNLQTSGSGLLEPGHLSEQ